MGWVVECIPMDLTAYREEKNVTINFFRRNTIGCNHGTAWIVLSILALATNATAQSESKSKSKHPAQSVEASTNALSAPSTAPAIVCDEPSYNFGTVTGLLSVSHVFRIRNEGDAELVIKKVKPACGCTTTKLATNNIAPGAEVEIKTTLSLKSRSGRQTKPIMVYSNDPDNPRYRLVIVGTAHELIDLQPKKLNFRVNPQNPTTEQEMVITFNTGKPTRITEVKTNEAAFCSISLQETIVGKEYRLHAKLIPEHFEGQNVQRGRIKLKTDYPETPSISIRVSATYMSDVTVLPKVISMVISTNSPTPLTRPLLIKNNTRKPLNIANIALPLDVNVTTQVLNSTTTRLDIEFERPSTDLVDQEIKLRMTREPDNEYDFTIPLEVTFKPN